MDDDLARYSACREPKPARLRFELADGWELDPRWIEYPPYWTLAYTLGPA